MKKRSAYDPAKIEKKWQKKWASSKIYRSKEDIKKDKFYALDMFPYPSGEGLHVGHPKGYIATDIVSRMKRMQGMNVLHPMGFDAFGLPAENYAIKTKTNPADSVAKNVARYKEQLELLGFDYDWSREVNTTDPKFYKWTQWIFLQLWKKGLAFESNEPVNWCPTDKTVLANEDVEDGRCERCGTLVEKKPMRQWVLRITDYAERLLTDLDAKDSAGKPLLAWPEAIKESQRNWIGRSEGALIGFSLSLKGAKQRFVLIHGFEGSAHTNFFPWLKKELEKRGHEVQAPELPNPFSPKESEQVDFVLKNCAFDENTIVVGHSLGAVVALKALMKLNKPISSLVIAAAAVDPEFDTHYDSRPFSKDFAWDFDFNQIKGLVGGKVAVLSDLTEKFRATYLRHLATKLSAEFVEVTANEEHFCASEEPAILKAVTPSLSVFTTRPDTIFGVTYVVVAPEHPWIKELLPKIENRAEVEAYIERTKSKTEIDRTDATREKTGVELKGVRAVNPANKEEIPVWIADYVLADYGTGAVMAVPAHDERDFAFAKKFSLPIKQVIEPLIIRTEGTDAIKPDQGFVEREAVVCIIKHWSQDKYLMSFYKANGWKGFVVGGIEKGETVATSGVREIKEETGYSSARFVRSVGRIHSKFYHAVKNVNRFAHFEVAFFELQSDERAETSQTEKDLHDVVWLSPAEVEMAINREDIRLAWEQFKDNSCYSGHGILVSSGSFTGQRSLEAMNDITRSFGVRQIKYKLRDWVFSRQRYWGEPIPLIHCEKCGVVPVPEKDLPVKLPKVNSYEPTGTGESPLAAIAKWVNVKCPQCRGKARRETNTMPQWAGSSWYYLRYMDPNNSKALVDIKKEKHWSPVDLYVGGAEHATRHLIYARFWHKFLYDIGAVSSIEPFAKLQSVGLIMGEDGRKMSKRFGNVVNPDEIVKIYGADTLRVYEMFMGPFDQAIPWSTESIVGSRRFIERVWKLADKAEETAKRAAAVRVIHRTIKKVTEDIENLRFNTAISTLMIALNELDAAPTVARSDFESFLKLLAPFAPHVAEELWLALGNKGSVHISSWPTYDPALLIDSEAKIVLQIDGKTRGSFTAPTGAGKDELERLAKAQPEAKKWLENKQVNRVIVVPGKLVNIVLS